MVKETSFVLFSKHTSWPIQFVIVGKGLDDNEQKITDGITIRQANGLATLIENPEDSSVLIDFRSQRKMKYNAFWHNNSVFRFISPYCRLDLSKSGANKFARKIREIIYSSTTEVDNVNINKNPPWLVQTRE